MEYLEIISLALKYGPVVKEILDSATSNQDAGSKIQRMAAPLASILEGVGKTFFPKAEPALHVVAGAMAAFDPNTTKWVQNACNTLLDPSPHLVVDGAYGPKTKAAVERLQTQLGVKVDGWAGALTQAAISAVLK